MISYWLTVGFINFTNYDAFSVCRILGLLILFLGDLKISFLWTGFLNFCWEVSSLNHCSFLSYMSLFSGSFKSFSFFFGFWPKFDYSMLIVVLFVFILVAVVLLNLRLYIFYQFWKIPNISSNIVSITFLFFLPVWD